MKRRTKEFQCLPFRITTDVEIQGALLGTACSSCAVQVHGGLRRESVSHKSSPVLGTHSGRSVVSSRPTPGQPAVRTASSGSPGPGGWLPLGREVIRAGVPATAPRGAAHPRGESPACFWHPRRHVPTRGPVPQGGGPATPCAAPPAAPRRAPPPLPSPPRRVPRGGGAAVPAQVPAIGWNMQMRR